MIEKHAGLWRGPMGKELPKPTRCKDCRSKDLEYDLASVDDEHDGELSTAWEQAWEDGETIGRRDDDPDWEPDRDGRFSYIRVHAECMACNYWTQEYGPRYFWNPDAGGYDLPAPLMPAEARIAEAEAIRQAKIEAGQLQLFD